MLLGWQTATPGTLPCQNGKGTQAGDATTSKNSRRFNNGFGRTHLITSSGAGRFIEDRMERLLRLHSVVQDPGLNDERNSGIPSATITLGPSRRRYSTTSTAVSESEVRNDGHVSITLLSYFLYNGKLSVRVYRHLWLHLFQKRSKRVYIWYPVTPFFPTCLKWRHKYSRAVLSAPRLYHFH